MLAFWKSGVLRHDSGIDVRRLDMRIPITLSSLFAVLALTFIPALARAERMTSDKTVSGSLSNKPIGDQIEMFSGIKSGDIEVTFIPKDTTEATILFKNMTGKP